MTGIPAEHSAVLPCEPASARLARAFVRDFCDYTGLPPEVQDDAMLLTSEIVANAVTHGRSEVRLSVRVAPAGIRVEAATTTADIQRSGRTTFRRSTGEGFRLSSS